MEILCKKHEKLQEIQSHFTEKKKITKMYAFCTLPELSRMSF